MSSKPATWVLLLFFAPSTGCTGSPDALTAVAESHLEGNIPKGKLFNQFLTRDLRNYLCGAETDCTVEYELLRERATQSSISYPKYYLWVKRVNGNGLTEEGAVRVAAIDNSGFNVTHFLSREKILDSPSQVPSIFPATIVDQIVKKAHGK